MIPPTTSVPFSTARPLESTTNVPLRQLVRSSDVPGNGPKERSNGNMATMPKIPAPMAKSPPSSLRRLTTTAERSTSAADIALRSSGEEARTWRSSTNGPCGMRYFPHAVSPKPSRNMPAPKVPPRTQGFQFCVKAMPNPAVSTMATTRTRAMSAFDPAGVPGRVAEVLVAQGGDRHGHLGPGRLVAIVLVAHERSPIQKQMRARPPTPSSRAMKPSATGPTPPRPAPPGLAGCWMLWVT